MTLYYLRGYIERTNEAIATISAQVNAIEGATVAVSNLQTTVDALQADVNGLATVATSGSYTDLLNQPTIPQAGVDFVAPGSLAAVATSGSYTDLLNQPTIPQAGVDFVAPGSLATVATSGSYTDLLNQPAIPQTGVDFVAPGSLAAVATSGSYTDLLNQPAIPRAGVDFVPVAGGTFTGQIIVGGDIRLSTDGGGQIGGGAKRFSNIYLLNSPVVSSDEREKFNQRRLSPQELAVGEAIADLVYTRANDPALHFGVSAQAVAQAFVDHGLDPTAYAVNINEEGNLGIRYTELFILLQAAIKFYLEQHRVELNTLAERVTALEGGV